MKGYTSLKIQVTVLSLLITLASPVFAMSDETSDFFAFSIGGFDINDDKTAAEVRFEYRAQSLALGLRPFSGVMLNHDAAIYGYGGLLLDIYLNRRVVVTPSFAAGFYRQGSSKDLGSDIEFRSQLEISFFVDDRSRMALSLGHMSNASIDDKNPGTESLVLSYIVPFSILLRQ